MSDTPDTDDQDTDLQDGADHGDAATDTAAPADAEPHASLIDAIPDDFDLTQIETPEERKERERRARAAELARARRRGIKLPPLPTRGKGYKGIHRPGTVAARTRPDLLRAAARARQAYEYRLQGYSYQQIAESLNFNSKQAAEYAVKSVIKRLDSETGELAKSLWSERLDALLAPFFAQALAGDAVAAELCMKIMRDKGALAGVSLAPTKVAFTDPTGQKEASPMKVDVSALLQMAREAKARNAAEDAAESKEGAAS